MELIAARATSLLLLQATLRITLNNISQIPKLQKRHTHAKSIVISQTHPNTPKSANTEKHPNQSTTRFRKLPKLPTPTKPYTEAGLADRGRKEVQVALCSWRCTLARRQGATTATGISSPALAMLGAQTRHSRTPTPRNTGRLCELRAQGAQRGNPDWR